jgi:hypothetical protein
MQRILTVVIWLIASLQMIAQNENTNNNIAKLSEQLAKVSREQSKELTQEIASIKEKLQKGEIQGDEAEDMIRDATEFSNRRLERRINRIMREMEEEIAKLYEVSVDDIEGIEPPALPAPPAPPVPPAPPTFNEDDNRATDLMEDEMEDAMEDAEDALEDARDALEDAREDARDAREDAREDDDEDDDDDWKEELKREWKGSFKKDHKDKKESRHTSQFVFALGLNNLVTGNDIGTFDNDDIELRNSRFYEWGITGKYRLLPNSSLLQFKYGVSLLYNNLRPSGNRIFQRFDPNDPSPFSGQTVLVNNGEDLRNEAYLRITQLNLPVHLEFDFSRNDKVYMRSQQGVRLGVGGYAGIVTRAKQLYESRNPLGQITEVETRGRWGTNNVVYGLSSYIGYKDFSFYIKYDINPLFKNNPIEQNNTSIGVRFDFH